jgi:type II secretory pathway component PulC
MAVAAPDTISSVEAVISSINRDTVELQITGSYETFCWPKNLVKKDINVGEKIWIEIKNPAGPGNELQNIIEKAKAQDLGKDPVQQQKLLEKLIN